MSASNNTTNYNLPIYMATDKPKYLTDFNNAMTTIDTVIKQVADSIPSNVEQIQEQLTETTTTANTAKSTADTAKSTADTANQTANQNENVLAMFFEGFTNWQNWTPES